MSRDRKIEKINAYKKVIETKRLPKVDLTADKTVDHEILEEFSLWAEAQLSLLLGEEKTSDTSLTDDETALLKAFAQRLKKKINSQDSEPVQSVQPQAPAKKQSNGTTQSEPEEDRGSTVPIGHRLKKKSSDYLSALDDLDRQSPKY